MAQSPLQHSSKKHVIQNSLSGWTGKTVHNLAYLLPMQRAEIPRTFGQYSAFFNALNDAEIIVPEVAKWRNEGDAFRISWTSEEFLEDIDAVTTFLKS